MMFSFSPSYDDSDVTDCLVARAKTGDNSAYQSLIARVNDRLLFFVRARMGSKLRRRVQAEDIVQETFLQAHKSFDSFANQGEAAFCKWLYRIAEHRILDQAAHFGASKRAAEGQALSVDPALAEILPIDHTGPATEAGLRDDQERILDALTNLEEDDRDLLLMRFFHELPLQAMAEKLDRPKTTIRRALARAIRALGRCLLDDGDKPNPN
jgi:RNA polymerase sigma-70 factor (ECF subfamily)